MIQITFPEIYDLNHTFCCGQIFRFTSVNNGRSYIGPLEDRIIEITQKSPHILQISSNKTRYLEKKVNKFFRVQDDYKKC